MLIHFLDSDAARAAAIDAINNAPANAVVTIGDRPSTVAQRKCFWAVMREIADGLWVADAAGRPTMHTTETWAEYFLDRYAPRREMVVVGGSIRWIREPIARIDAVAFGHMLERIEAEASMMGLEFHEQRGTLDEWQAAGKRLAAHIRAARVLQTERAET